MPKKVAKVFFSNDGVMWSIKIAWDNDPNTFLVYISDFQARLRPVFDICSMIGMNENELYENVRTAWLNGRKVHV